MIKGANKYYYSVDGLGSVVNLTDSSGNIVESYTYDEYGNVSAPSQIGNRYLYTSREYDPEINLYYYRARYYDPSIGRFLQTDPIGYIGGINLYTYAGNNPVNWIDPFGYKLKGPRRYGTGKKISSAVANYGSDISSKDANAMKDQILDTLESKQVDQARELAEEINDMFKDKTLTPQEAQRLKDIIDAQRKNIEDLLKGLKEKYPNLPWDKLKEALEKALKEELKKKKEKLQ